MMKNKIKKSKGIVKGAPSGFLISLAIHAAAFLLAGMLVVFTVNQKEEKKFVPPKPVDRPKMKLKKPKVMVKKSAKPKSTTRIVTKVKRASMPDIQLPEMSGMGEALAGGLGAGFDLMPDLGEITAFGSGQSIGNDFVGTFYDLNRSRSGSLLPAMDSEKYVDIVTAFLNSGWRASRLARYYQSPKKLYATTFMMPFMPSGLAPAAFGEDDTGGYMWLAHYKGQLVHKEGITFRFVGKADDVFIIRVDGKVVLIANHDNWIYNYPIGKWQSSSPDSEKWRVAGAYAIVGDWITLEPGVPLDMEVLIGEIPGGTFAATLVVQEKDVEYERSFGGGIILPIFKTEEPSLDLVDAIYEYLIEDGASVTNGPVFRDYDSGERSVAVVPAEVEPSAPDEVVEDKLRVWTGQGGKILEAEFVNVIGDNVVLKDARGKIRKIPLAQVSAEDRKYIELAQPPEFDISFSKLSSLRTLKPSPYSEAELPKLLDYVFGAKLRQTSSGSYGSELHVEFFAIGEEIDGDNYILFDRQESSFVPSRENKRSHEFFGNSVELMDYNFREQRRGEKYGGYLVVVTDVRGKIIDHDTSHEWLFENLERLKKIPVGKHFDKTVTRVHPPRPKRDY